MIGNKSWTTTWHHQNERHVGFSAEEPCQGAAPTWFGPTIFIDNYLGRSNSNPQNAEIFCCYLFFVGIFHNGSHNASPCRKNTTYCKDSHPAETCSCTWHCWICSLRGVWRVCPTNRGIKNDDSHQQESFKWGDFGTTLLYHLFFGGCVYPFAYKRLDLIWKGKDVISIAKKSLLEVFTVGVFANSVSMGARGLLTGKNPIDVIVSIFMRGYSNWFIIFLRKCVLVRLLAVAPISLTCGKKFVKSHSMICAFGFRTICWPLALYLFLSVQRPPRWWKPVGKPISAYDQTRMKLSSHQHKHKMWLVWIHSVSSSHESPM